MSGFDLVVRDPMVAVDSSFNPYAVLGVPQGADSSIVNRAFRRLSRLCHPDLHPGKVAARRFEILCRARDEVLGQFARSGDELAVLGGVQSDSVSAITNDDGSVRDEEVSSQVMASEDYFSSGQSNLYYVLSMMPPDQSLMYIHYALLQALSLPDRFRLSDDLSSYTRMFRQPVPALPAGYQTQNGLATESRSSIPEEFICPLSGQVMDNPVELPSGQVCERAFVVEWLRQKPQNPFTRASMDKSMLVPETDLKARIDEYVAGAIPRLTR